MRAVDPLERFRQKYEREENGCWSWTGTISTKGYGNLWAHGRNVLAHRFSYEQLVGAIPEGLVVDHLCRNRRCVNPAHLELVTIGENSARGLRGYGLRTHCERGLHDITKPGSTYVRPDNGRRNCRECYLEVARASKRRAKLRRAEVRG